MDLFHPEHSEFYISLTQNYYKWIDGLALLKAIYKLLMVQMVDTKEDMESLKDTLTKQIGGELGLFLCGRWNLMGRSSYRSLAFKFSEVWFIQLDDHHQTLYFLQSKMFSL